MRDTIVFAEEGTAVPVVQIDPADDVPALREKLGLDTTQAVLLVLTGQGFPTRLGKRQRLHLAELVRRGIALAASDSQAALLDNGTQTGVVALLGQGVADRHLHLPLIGCAPADGVTAAAEAQESGPVRLEPHHTAFVLAEAPPAAAAGEATACADPQAASEALFRLAEALAPSMPVVVVVAGDAAPRDVLRCVCHNWPVIVVEGSGGMAARIARLEKQRRGIERRRPRDEDRWWRKLWRWINRRELGTDDLDLRDIVLDGHLVVHQGGRSGEELRQAIHDRVQAAVEQRARRPPDPNTVLYEAWRQFALYDRNAARQQAYFYRLRGWPLFLGVLTTILVLSYTALKQWLGDPLPASLWPLRLAFDLAIISLPLVISILLAAETRFKAGNKWTMLRAAAEGIKSEIYRYRLRAKMIEARPAETDPDREKQQQERATYLAALQYKTEEMSQRMMRTDVNEAALHPYARGQPLPPRMYGAAGHDDGFGPLDTQRYIDIRIGDQLSYYEKKTNQLERQLRRYQWWILIYGGLGSLLVAVGGALWVPVTAAIVAALAAYLEFHGVEVSLRKYNQTAANLSNIRNKWLSYTPEEKQTPEKIAWLLDATERTLQYELSGWVQQMEDIVSGTGEPGHREGDGSGGPAQVQEQEQDQQVRQDHAGTDA